MSSLRTEENGGVLVVYFNDAKILDEATIQEIGKELIEKCDSAANGTKKMLVNFKEVSFMSSAMIGKIILLNKKAKEYDIKLKLCDISSNLMEVFKLMKLNKVLDIQTSEAKAVASFDKKGWFGS